MNVQRKNLINAFFVAPNELERFNICVSLSGLQRLFSWKQWEFGFHALNSPDLLHQLSAENLFKLIFLIIEADKDDHGIFDRVENSGILTKVFQVLLQRSNGIQHLSKSQIDPTFDFRSDTPPNKDPDAFSETLKLYHRVLWSKQLPSGQLLDLTNERAGTYLYFPNGETGLNLTSDAITHTYRDTVKLQSIIQDVPSDVMDKFYNSSFAIGGYILFPGGKRDGFQTINQARGCNLKIVDRFDLTLECIRRQYLGINNPLANTLSGYWDFFELFGDFRRYVEFFLLHDLVDSSFEKVKFHLPFDEEFPSRPFPKTVDEYLHYMNNTLTFIQRRTDRMLNFSKSLSFDSGQLSS